MAISRRKFLLASASATAGAALLSSGNKSGAAETPFVADAGWKSRQLARKPNIVVVVLDDVGFADLGCYGAEHNTKCIDDLAAAGTRFNNFHVTALCAPTRACLLTGRNAHAVGVGNIAEWGRADHPGYKGWIRQDALTLAEILKPAGYSTIATGKWHLSSLDDQNGTGPFDHWPVGRGFDHWYGFHGNAIDHWHPEMFENTSAAYPEKTDDYHLSADLVDRSIYYIADHLAASPEDPFFLYLAFGAMHFPLHAPADDIRRHRGRYDQGWDAVRADRFARQLEYGIVPDGTRLAPRNPDVPAWPELSKKERQLAARGQEVYAAFLEHTDLQLQRLVDFLKAEQQFDDTIILVLSDNGAAYGGPIEGRLDVRRDAYLGPAPIEEFLADIDLMGSDASYCSYSRGWAQAGNTPLKWYKSDTYEGGIRAPLIASWPNGGLPSGAMQPDIVGGEVMYPIDRAREIVAFYTDYAFTAPEELYCDFWMQRTMTGEGDGVGIHVCFSGPEAQAEKALAPVRALGKPLFDSIRKQPYVAIQQSWDNTDPRNEGQYLKSGFVNDLPAELANRLVDGFEGDPGRNTTLFFQHSGGAIGRVAPDATAFAHRKSQANMFCTVTWPLDSDATPQIDYLRRYWTELEPYTDGWYTNDASDEPQRVLNANYQGNFARLQKIKNQHDPGNLFRLNANIKPTV